MPSYRVDRLNKDFKKELSAIIPNMKDTRIDAFLTVMRVEVTNDLSYGKVYIGSVQGFEAAHQACKVLEKAQGYIKTELARRLRIRKVPELRFIADDSVEYYHKIDTILKGFNDEQSD
jgi:ribosome-binding factor A